MISQAGFLIEPIEDGGTYRVMLKVGNTVIGVYPAHTSHVETAIEVGEKLLAKALARIIRVPS